MVNITNKTACCGCSACTTCCPKQCITMKEDDEGFSYPEVDMRTCINCGLCEKVCHELHPYDERKPLNVYAAINNDEQIRLNSSSGGIFFLMAEKTIREGGIVFGARFEDDWQVVLDYAETLDGVKQFMGSKYVQAQTGSAYKDAESFLQQGRNVLFSGTPCQIAGLHHYLRKHYNNLTTVDFVCHGVPSPKVWRTYLSEVVSSIHKIDDIKFRNKSNGWKKFNFVLSYKEENHNIIISSYHKDNHYMRAFLSDMILRPSCYNCKAKYGSSHSDITIADFWGIQNVMQDMDDDKGTGMVFINTEKGRDIIDWEKMTYRKSTEDIAYKYNRGLSSVREPHKKRKKFFAHLNKTESVIDLINRCLQPPIKTRIRMRLSLYKRKIISFMKKPTCAWGGVFCESLGDNCFPIMPQNAKISNVNFRNKEAGWKQYHVVIHIKL